MNMKENFPKRRTENYLVKKELGKHCYYVKINFAPLDFCMPLHHRLRLGGKVIYLLRSEGNMDLGCNIERQGVCSFVGFLMIHLCVDTHN